MKIAMLSPTFAPRIGGAETHVGELASELVRLGHEVSVITNRDSPESTRYERTAVGVDVHRCRSMLDLRTDPNAVPWEHAFFSLSGEIASIMSDLGPDIIHTHTQASLLISEIAGLNEVAPLVASFHETEPLDEAFGRQRNRFITAASRADAYVVGSEFFYRQALAMGLPKSKVHVVSMGVRDRAHESRGTARRELFVRFGIPEEPCLVALVGRFTARKRHALLLDALERAQQPLVAVLAGSSNSSDPSYLDELKLRVGASPSNAFLIEEASEETRNLVLDATDFGVQPSRIEGLGLAALELMLSGVPVVCSDVDGLREVIGPHSTLLIDTADVEKFSTKLDELASNPTLRMTLGSTLRARALKEFSSERTALLTERIYATLRRRSYEES